MNQRSKTYTQPHASFWSTCMSASQATACKLNTQNLRGPKITQTHTWEDQNMQVKCNVAHISMTKLHDVSNMQDKDSTSNDEQKHKKLTERSTCMNASQATTSKLHTLCVAMIHKHSLRPTWPNLVPSWLFQSTCMRAAQTTTCKHNTLWLRDPKHTLQNRQAQR